ncbi:PTS sugar transporter subunit IIC [Senegalia massiliensis]|uniref:Permease IIC component n=1 Tax=Senegalia massiliensis TaxID=1720316 RepID=A0A845QVX7_9CLOT|nr:PTS transporter subunit EIIC [Senegalia massiliensis]NBI07077.1 PTS sugar transporter subunit IIC [Senegalia massiliensis]
MMERIEKIFLPLANKLSTNRYLAAIRDGFVAILPIMIAGSFFILINNVFIGEDGFTDKLFGMPFENLKQLGASIAPATLSVMSILLTFTTAKALTEYYKDDTTILPTISVVSLFILMPITFDGDLGIEYINTFYTGSAALFMAFISSIFTVEILHRLSKVKKLIIKMPESVPPSIARSFNKLVPVLITMLIFGVIRIITNLIGSPLNNLIFELIQTPFTNIVSSTAGVIIIYFLYMLLWGMGVHSAFIFNPILEPIFLTSLSENVANVEAGSAMTEIITKPFIDSFMFMGGAGNMLALIIAIFIVSRKEEYRKIGKIGLAPALFNISEPIMFGLPVVMNPILIIPMIVSTLAGLGIGMIATTIGIISNTYILIPWTTPPIISAFLATGGDFFAAIVALVVLVVSVLIYMPFVAITNKQRIEYND